MAETILPHALPGALDGRGDIALLSLDCFDTLLWRDTHAPTDLFGALPGITSPQRQWAEERARSSAVVRHLENEVTIEEIYAELMPNSDAAARKAAVQAELDAEARHCFAFRPAVDLMREAKRRGIAIAIVSDTYLDKDQLRGLIAAAAGEDVAGMIDHVFCSSKYRASKAEGLYRHVLAKLKIAPERILHIGDNAKADVEGVAPFKVQTLHLKQFTASTEQRIRLEASIAGMMHPRDDGGIDAAQPHRAALAMAEPLISDPAEALGFTTLGPVLHGFERWLRGEAEALAAANGGTVHYVYMMRDGHLPRLVHEASGNPAPAHAVEISRFAAIAASFHHSSAVDRYLEQEIGGDLAVLAKQLLFSQTEIAVLMGKLPERGRAPAFLRMIREPQRMRTIVKRSREYGQRLLAHVRGIVAPAPGDTLMLIDLGYNGSAQNDVEAVLRAGLGVEVAGRYLLLREQLVSGYDKRGYIGHDRYDAIMLEALCSNVAVIEQLCTAAYGSVVDFEADGTPMRRGNSIKGRQSVIRERVQKGCTGFVHAAAVAAIRAGAQDDRALWQLGAAGVLARLMFLPLPQELDVIQAFEHDVNLGVDYTVALFDQDIARKGLRRRGLFYLKGSERMYLPAELNGEGLPIKLTLLAQKLFGMRLKYTDFIDQTVSLPVIVADGREVSTGNVTATPTHDGYYVAPIPIGDCRFSVGLQFGLLYDWLQVESAVFMPVERFLAKKQRPGLEEVEAAPSLEGMEQTAPHLFRCENEAAFMMVPPPPRQDDRPMMLAVTFRPIVARPPKPAAQTAPAIIAAGAAA